jgi:hypothetical protein
MCSLGVLHGDICLRNFARDARVKRIKVLDLDQSRFDNDVKAQAAERQEVQELKSAVLIRV